MTSKTSLDLDLRRYYAEIQRNLDCAAKERSKIMEQIKSGVDDYISQNPDCTMKDIEKQFGSAAEISEMHLSVEDTEKIHGRMKNNRTVRDVLILIAIAVLVVAVAIGIVIVWNNYVQFGIGNYTDGVEQVFIFGGLCLL